MQQNPADKSTHGINEYTYTQNRHNIKKPTIWAKFNVLKRRLIQAT